MCWRSGEEELEIVDHGWAQKLTSFEQETGNQEQYLPRNGKPFLKSVVQDAQRNLTQLPFFNRIIQGQWLFPEAARDERRKTH